MNDIDVSVVIPVYNVERFIVKTIESVQRQDFESYEIILVDDGSSDSSGKICDQYADADNRIVVIHKANGGVMSARFAGVDAARGKYIAFLDGDDRMPSDAIANMYEAINSNDVDYVIGACVDINPEGKRINNTIYKAEFDGFINDNISYRSHIARRPRGMNMKMYKKDVLIAEPRVVIPPTIRNNEDLIFNILLSSKINRVMAINDIVALIVEHSGSASRRPYKADYWCDLFEWMDLNYKKYGVFENDYMMYKLMTLYYKIVREHSECDYRHRCFENLKKYKYRRSIGFKRNIVLFVAKHPYKIIRGILSLHPKRFLIR